LRSYFKETAPPVYKIEINGPGDPLRGPRNTFYPLKSALTSPTSGGSSVGIVSLRTAGHGVCLFVYLPIDLDVFMKWSPSSEGNSCSAGQKISQILQNVNFQQCSLELAT
jgi:hypothetical protein